MELNNRNSQEGEDVDKFSMLTDDIILSILGRVDITTAVRTSILSTRWKHLPWLLHELTIDVKDFLPTPHPNPIEAEHSDVAMASVAKVIKSFLATHRTEVTISRLQFMLYLVDNHLDVIGPLLTEAIDSGIIKDLDFSILDEKDPEEHNPEEMLQQARSVDQFFSAYPNVLCCLTRLSLYNVCFAEWDINHILFDCSKHLQHLYLSNCDAGALTWKIHAPDSNLSVLILDSCFLVKLEVSHLQKLERFHWDGWLCPDIPLLLGVVPSLKELYLMSGAPGYFKGFKLSEALGDATAIQDLTLCFQGEKLWMLPEGELLCAAFSNLRKLSLHDIFVEFDLLWTIVLLEAAPSVEIFDVEIWEHPCVEDTNERRQVYGERTNPSWKVAEFRNRKEWLLKEVQITGFSPMEQQITFIKALMQRAPNLQTVVLKDHGCKDCEKLPRSERSKCIFPKGEDEQDVVVNRLIGDTAYSCVQIIFKD